MHLIYGLDTDAKATLSFFEGATVSANGTALTAWNNDRNSANTAALAVYHTPTITDAGTQIDIHMR